MGAQVAFSAGTVVVVAGDGSFQMNIQELATCVQEDLPVIVVVMNNGYLGMVRQWQELFFEWRYSSVCLQSCQGCGRSCGKERAAPDGLCPPYTPDFPGSPGRTGLTDTVRGRCPNSATPSSRRKKRAARQ